MPIARRLNAIDTALDPALIARFRADLERLHDPPEQLGIAVSGGPDSLALLLLAHAAGARCRAATVDHGLRRESAGEAATVARICAERGIEHAILRVEVEPGNLQANARRARYGALSEWAEARTCGAVATAHHADDQAETVLMRLNRGSGSAGLAGIRERAWPGESGVPVIRPLLRWRKSELEGVVQGAGVQPIRDPSNANEEFDRVRVRQALAGADWLDPLALSRSAAALADDDEALASAALTEWEQRVERFAEGLRYRPTKPRAIRLRVLSRAIGELGHAPRGAAVGELERGLQAGHGGNLGGVAVLNADGAWELRRENPRRSS